MPLSRTDRIRLFLFGCIPVRLALVYLSTTRYLPYMTLPAAAVALGFTLIYLFGLRPTGAETGGQPIWWDALRPLHALLYALFAYLAYRTDTRAWVPLALDAAIGLVAFTQHHFR